MQIWDLGIKHATLAYTATQQPLIHLGSLNLGMQDPLGEQNRQTRLNRVI